MWLNLLDVGDSRPQDFVSKMLATLDSPSEVWNSIFINLPPIAQRLLVSLASLPSEVLLEDVRSSVEGLCGRRLEVGEFRSALTLLEGTFIALKKANPAASESKHIVEIRDASILDYLWGRLQEDVSEVDSLLERAVFFEQCVVLYNRDMRTKGAFDGAGYRGTGNREKTVDVDVGSLATKALEVIDSRNPRLSQGMDDGHLYLRRDSQSLEYRAAFLVGIFAGNRLNSRVASVVSEVLESCVLKWEKRRGVSNECVYLLRRAKEVQEALPSNIVARLENALFNLITDGLHQTEDFAALLELEVLSPGLFKPPHRSIKSWRAEFRVFLTGEREWLLSDCDDPDDIEYAVSEIEHVADALGEDIRELVIAAQRHMNEMRGYDEYEPDEDMLRELYAGEHDSDESHSASGWQDTTKEIDSLFQSLL